MRNRTEAREQHLLPAMIVVAGLLCNPVGLERAWAWAGDGLKQDAILACQSGFAGTWVIDKVCDLGSVDLRAQDAIDIQCDAKTGQWSVDFYAEPVGADLDSPASQATRHALCPGNGRLVKGEDARMLLQCNYWDATDNISKQLEFALQGITEPDIESMRWLSREMENPNVVCGVAGRGEGGGDSGSSGRTINSL